MGRARDGLRVEVARVAEEVASERELAAEVLPRLARAFDLSGWHLIRSSDDEPLEVIGTSSPAIHAFRDGWLARDPVALAYRGRRLDPVLAFSRLPGWPKMARHPLYAEFAPSWGFGHFACLSLSSAPFLSPGAVMLMMMRPPRRRDFEGDDLLDLAQLHPCLRAAVARAGRVARAHALLPVLETLVEREAPGMHLAFGARGQLVWASPDAERLSGALREPLRRVLAEDQPLCVSFVAGGARLRAELTPVKRSLVLVRVQPADDDAARRQLGARFGLTPTESAILADVAAGHSNAVIAARRAVALNTVRTHVARILDKLGVHSRLEAALVVQRGR